MAFNLMGMFDREERVEEERLRYEENERKFRSVYDALVSEWREGQVERHRQQRLNNGESPADVL